MTARAWLRARAARAVPDAVRRPFCALGGLGERALSEVLSGVGTADSRMSRSEDAGSAVVEMVRRERRRFVGKSKSEGGDGGTSGEEGAESSQGRAWANSWNHVVVGFERRRRAL